MWFIALSFFNSVFLLVNFFWKNCEKYPSWHALKQVLRLVTLFIKTLLELFMRNIKIKVWEVKQIIAQPFDKVCNLAWFKWDVIGYYLTFVPLRLRNQTNLCSLAKCRLQKLMSSKCLWVASSSWPSYSWCTQFHMVSLVGVSSIKKLKIVDWQVKSNYNYKLTMMSIHYKLLFVAYMNRLCDRW